MCGLFCSLWVIVFGSWVSEYCPVFPMASTFLPSTDFPNIGLWIQPLWQNQWHLMHMLMTMKHKVFTIWLYKTQTSRCLCIWDTLKLPIGMSANPHLRSLTLSKNHFLNGLTTHHETSDAQDRWFVVNNSINAPCIEIKRCPPVITDKNCWEHNDYFSAADLETTTGLSSQHDSFCCRALHKGLP